MTRKCSTHQQKRDAEILKLHNSGVSISALISEPHNYYWDAYDDKAAKKGVITSIKRARHHEKMLKKRGENAV